MKKQYISPETLSQRLNLENIMLTPSITGSDGNLDHDISIGSETENDGDSRRHHDIWEDEEEEELY